MTTDKEKIAATQPVLDNLLAISTELAIKYAGTPGGNEALLAATMSVVCKQVAAGLAALPLTNHEAALVADAVCVRFWDQVGQIRNMQGAMQARENGSLQ